MTPMTTNTMTEIRIIRRRGIVHTFVFIACIYTLGSSSAQSQVSDLQLISRASTPTAAIDGVAYMDSGYVGLGMPAAPVSASPNITISEVSSSRTPALPMIAAATPSDAASDYCLEKIPDNFVRASLAQGSPNQPPEAPSAYRPLSPHCKLQLFLRRAYSPYTFASAAFEAGIAQMSAQWPQYGGGMQGWGKRYGATLTDTESRRFIQTYLLSTVLHQDPRYFPSTSTSLIGRAWYAATRVVVTRGDNGHSQFNASEMLGALSTSALQNSYYPQHYRTVDATISRFTGALSSDATSAILREFTPDLKRMFNRHCPRKLKAFEDKLPLPEEDKP
jgi:hypothetical protein